MGYFHLLKNPGKLSEDLNLFYLLHNKHLRWEFFTAYQVSKCPQTHSDQKKKSLVCFRFNHAFSFLQKAFVTHSNEARKDFKQFIKDMRPEVIEDEAAVETAIDLTIDFLSKIVAINNGPGRNPKTIVVKVKDINRILFSNSTSNFEWLRIINNFFLDKSAANVNDDVLIENSEVRDVCFMYILP